MDVTSNIMLNDSELLKIERGPYAWALSQQKKTLNIDQFTKDLKEQFNQIGLQVTVKVFDTNESGVYGFEVEINGRVLGSFFDPDRQVHEAVSNILSLPGEDGWINTNEAFKEQRAKERLHGKPKHKH